MLNLSACTTVTNTSYTAPASQIRKILAEQTLPYQVLDKKKLFDNFNYTVGLSKKNEVIWKFRDKDSEIDSSDFLTATATLVENSDKTTNVNMMIELNANRKEGPSKDDIELYTQFNKAALYKEGIRQNFAEFVRSTLTEQRYDVAKSGHDFLHENAKGISREMEHNSKSMDVYAAAKCTEEKGQSVFCSWLPS
jgi:hypothetical protein